MLVHVARENDVDYWSVCSMFPCVLLEEENLEERGSFHWLSNVEAVTIHKMYLATTLMLS